MLGAETGRRYDRKRGVWFVVATALVPFVGCGLVNERHGCATDDDCLAGKICSSGICSARPATSAAGEGGGGTGGTHHGSGGMVGSALGAGETSEGGTNTGGAGRASSGGSSGPKASGGRSGRGGGTAGHLSGTNGGAGSSSKGGNGPVSGRGGENGQGADGGGGEGGVPPPPLQCDPELDGEQIECVSNWASNSLLPISIAGGVAISGVATGYGGYQLYASKGDSDMVGTSWSDNPISYFGPFSCFDALPGPQRMAGTTCVDDSSEVFVVARCGTVWSRHLDGPAWSDWTPVSLPSAAVTDAGVTDVAVTRLPGVTNFLYVVDQGRVYVTHRTGPTSKAPFGDWTLTANGAGHLIAAGTRTDGRQQLFTLDQQGRPLTTGQTGGEPDAPFDDWIDFSSPGPATLVDIEAIDGLDPLEVFAVDSFGQIWTSHEVGPGAFSAWTRSPGPAAPAVFTLIAGAGLYGWGDKPMALAAVSPFGVFVSQREADVWYDWQQLE